MKSAQNFKVAIFLLLVPLAGAVILNSCADLMRPSPVDFFKSNERIPSKQEIETSRYLTIIAPARTDLKADLAQSLGILALKSDAGYLPSVNQDAQVAARQALEAGPYDSKIWLILALLAMQKSAHDARTSDFLKMSYLTGASSLELIPTRIAAVSQLDAIGDTDLQELARGDIRLILNRVPEIKPVLASAHRHASPEMKAFIEDSVATIDPQFAGTLRNQAR
ncbi:hypothetical protein SAMN05444159_1707 [Bradyrhizobium lablabi]|uniref:Uncharacterized protein n=1 Tax=Bradyrhizobium lablabi TaxID=722472 RepID=A0A1M6MQR6_9BRAD|nr:hypothetical protein [Bradyrhizobium lablabi]SHJ85865.1 hypothetical protein SAMN05444159_1707 [Bradyrhizobium lablabi]